MKYNQSYLIQHILMFLGHVLNKLIHISKLLLDSVYKLRYFLIPTDTGGQSGAQQYYTVRDHYC